MRTQIPTLIPLRPHSQLFRPLEPFDFSAAASVAEITELVIAHSSTSLERPTDLHSAELKAPGSLVPPHLASL